WPFLSRKTVLHPIVRSTATGNCSENTKARRLAGPSHCVTSSLPGRRLARRRTRRGLGRRLRRSRLRKHHHPVLHRNHDRTWGEGIVHAREGHILARLCRRGNVVRQLLRRRHLLVVGGLLHGRR